MFVLSCMTGAGKCADVSHHWDNYLDTIFYRNHHNPSFPTNIKIFQAVSFNPLVHCRSSKLALHLQYRVIAIYIMQLGGWIKYSCEWPNNTCVYCFYTIFIPFHFYVRRGRRLELIFNVFMSFGFTTK